MTGFEFPEVVSQWANYILVWIGFGTVVGLLAKAIMPGRDPGGALTTVLMGITGSVIGAGTLTFFFDNVHISPLSPLGLVVATCGSLLLLAFYRLLSGHLFGETSIRNPFVNQTHPVRRRVTVTRDQ